MLNENDNAAVFFDSLKKALAGAVNEKILIITVVNCHENSPAEYKNDNLKLLEKLQNNFYQLSDLAVFDFTTAGKTLKNGVGEARRKGMDYALGMFDYDDYDNAVIASLDADTIIKEDYFIRIREKFNANPDAGVLTFNVKHQNDAANPEAITRYENYMQSYLEGLEFAGSPYAFYTVGSAFAVRAPAYIRAGGMRKIPAGEDFYFLQSAVKSSKVLHCKDITVHPSARNSLRVPFGTGTALLKITENPGEYAIFPHSCFEKLKILLNIASEPSNLAAPETFLAAIPEDFRDFFIQHNFHETWRRVTLNIPSGKLPDAFLQHWFDGLKTLQFIKYINL